MQPKFSFKDSIIYADVGDKVQVFAKHDFQSRITLKIESTNTNLNGFYQIQANGFILEFTYTEFTTIKAARIWGAIWDFDGYLDIQITNTEELIQSAPATKTKPILPRFVKRKNKKQQGFSRDNYIFKKSDNDQYTIQLDTKFDISKLFVSDNANITVFNQHQTINNEIKFSHIQLLQLGVILNVSINNIVYHIPGQEIDSEKDLEQLVYQLRWLFTNQNIDVYVYKSKKDISINRVSKHIKNIKLIGAICNLEAKFDTKNQYLNKLCITHTAKSDNWVEDTIKLEIDSNIKNNTSTITIQNKKPTKQEVFDIQILDNICSIKATVGEHKDYILSCKELGYCNLQHVNGSDVLNWQIVLQKKYPQLTFNLKSPSKTIQKIVNTEIDAIKPKLYHKLKNYRNFSYLYVYSNLQVDERHDIDLTIIDNQHTKLNRDFKIPQKRFVVDKGQKEKKIKINWVTKKPYRSFTIHFGDHYIPVTYIDKEYYPSNIKVENTKHSLNKGVDKILILRYQDTYSSGEIKLNNLQTSFDYVAQGNSVLWSLYDNNRLVWQKDVFYTQSEKIITIQHPLQTKFDKPFDIKFILNKKYNKPIKLKIYADSNLDLDLDKTIEISINKQSSTYTVTPRKSKKIGWLIFRAESLNPDITIDDSKKVVMFD